MKSPLCSFPELAALVRFDIFIKQQIKTRRLLLPFSMNQSSLRVYVQLSWNVSSSRRVRCASAFEQCCALCINLRARLQGGRAESSTWPQEPNIASFVLVHNQRNGKNPNPRGCSGWNWLDIVDDNAASCVYVAKEYGLKSFITKEPGRLCCKKFKNKTVTGPCSQICWHFI